MLASEAVLNLQTFLFVSIYHFVHFDEIAFKPLLLKYYLDIDLELTRAV